MPVTTKNTSAPKTTPKKGVGSGNNRPKKIKDITKVTRSITVDPTVWDNAKKLVGRRLSAKIEEYLKIITEKKPTENQSIILIEINKK